jgi:ADP-heptose:LPS heptosyltransferase/glycosyltransferase involved in cell wall biosynthesis
VRILVISNFYPPDHLSGSTLGCRNVVEALKARGHPIQVLTSTSGARKGQRDGTVHRCLTRDTKENQHWHDVFLKEVVNQACLKNLFQDFQPDVVFLFDLSEISVSLALVAQEKRRPVCFYVSSDWLATSEMDSWYQLWPKGKSGFKVLRFLSRHFELMPPSRPLDPTGVIFASHHLKNMALQVGQSVAQAAVIPWGVDVHRFSYRETLPRNPSRLLYAGQIVPQKGIDIAIETLGILKKEYGYADLSMTIAGDDKALPDYAAYLRDSAARNGVFNNLAFTGYIPPEKMPDLYQACDILLFPSVLEEPFTISLLEAMSCGTAVVSTASGGNSEILKNEFNALVIPKENPRLCARQILRLLQDPELSESLRANARRTIEERFRLEQSIDSIEGVLKDAVGQAGPDRQRFVVKGLPPGKKRARPESVEALSRRAKRWLKYGDFLVLSRAFLKPEFFIRKLKAAFQKTSSYSALLVFPFLYKGFFLLSGRRRQKASLEASQIRRVLVVQLADIGDVILTGPFLRELRRFLPRARVVLVVQPRTFNLVEKCPHIDEAVSFDWRAVKDWNNAFRGRVVWWLRAFGLARRRLWKHHFDAAISLRWNNDACQAASLILMYSSGAPQRIAYINGPSDFMLTRLGDVNRLTTQGPVRGAPKHEIEYQMDFLHFLGAHPDDKSLEVWTTPEDDYFAQNVLDQHRIKDTDFLIALAPGARWSFRRWPESHFLELGRWLQQSYNAHILIVAGEAERKLALNIERGLQRERTINLAGKTTLREMAALLKRCTLFVGIDSGPMHVAAATGVSVVALFGAGEYERFKPWGANHEVIRLGLSCYPCYENCKFEEALCTKGITVSQVKSVLSKKLGPLHQLEIKKD